MITTIASAYDAAAEHGGAEPHVAWLSAWRQFGDDWQMDLRPSPAELLRYLVNVPAEDRELAAGDLIAEHLRRSWQAGMGMLLDDYVPALAADMASLADVNAIPADLVEDEFLARFVRPHGDAPLLAEYAERFAHRPDISARLAGRCLAAERYVKLRVLGAGALGVVYEAFDRVMQRAVAVKETQCLGESASRRQQQLIDEACLTSELNHPGVVTIYDQGQCEHVAFYVMSLVSGQSLHERIGQYHAARAESPARERERLLAGLVNCLAEVCDAVAHAHSRGILHRDLKPANVIIAESGEAVIVDWGLARRLELPATACGLNPAKVIAGTPHYMAPEQADQQEGVPSDIFSLGASLYEVLTGRPPYDWSAGLPTDWRETVRQARITPPRQLAPDTPHVLDAICTKTLAKTPGDRYASAAELASDLQQFVQSQCPTQGWLAWLLWFRRAA